MSQYIDTDYSNDPQNPTPINWSGTVTPYQSLISNSVGDSDKADYLTFKVLPNHKLTGITLTSYKSTDGKAFIGLQRGEEVTASAANAQPLIGYTHFGSGQQGADVGANLITKLGGVLTAGTYSIWIQQLGPKTDYAFDLQLEDNSKPTGTPTLSGTLKVGSTLTIDKSSIKDKDNYEGWTPTYEYKWEVSTNSGKTWKELTSKDATDGDSTYKIKKSENGKWIRGVVSYMDGYGTIEEVATKGKQIGISAPKISLDKDSGQSSSDGITNKAKILVDDLSSSKISWQYSLNDGDSWTNGSGSSFTLSKHGTYSLKVRQKDGSSWGDASEALKVTLDTKAPTGTFKASSSKAEAGASLTVDLTFSEKVYGLAESDFSVSGGTLTDLEGSGKSWTATLKVEDDPNDTELTLSLKQGSYSDVAGNGGKAVSVSVDLLSTDLPVKKVYWGTDGNDAKSLSTKEFDAYALYGMGGDDTLKGGSGNDWLIGGAGKDVLTGGGGNDVFVVTSWKSEDIDVIRDFNAKDDAIAIDTDIFDASEDDTIEVVSYAQLKSKKEGLYDDLGVDVLVVKDTSRNLAKLNTEGYDKAIHLGILTDKKFLVYDEDGDWTSSKDQVKLMDFTSKFSTLWSGDNFLLGYNS